MKAPFHRCVDVPAYLSRKSKNAFTFVGGDASHEAARAVQSTDLKTVHLVSADIQGPLFGKSEAIVTWV